MARKIIDVGIVGNDGTGDSIRDSFRKVNDNFRELYSSLGLGERLTFTGLDETPDSFVGQENAIVAVNPTETGLVFKRLIAGTGIQFDYTNPNELGISTLFSEISADPSPQLGGNLSARYGGRSWIIRDLYEDDGITPQIPTLSHQAVNKQYADSKIALAGVNAIDPATGFENSALGTMTGPLVLSRDPQPSDDIVFDGLVAATKRYVDNAAFGSAANLYVASSGADARVGVSDELQGRALAYAYRSIEAALRRAEELVKESRLEIGPYRKVLTYNDGQSQCTLSGISTAPASGGGFDGDVFMSIDTISIKLPGTNYRPGDRLTLQGGVGEPAVYEILSTASTPGALVTFKQISAGKYSELPDDITNVGTDDDSAFGSGATFSVTFNVNSVVINSPGTGYSLVSVRFTGGGGTGAFGSATVVDSGIDTITITDRGTGFTSVPVCVVDLPRFAIYTNGLRTDFTGNVLSSSVTAIRSRDIREGLYLYGESSGALAQILAHDGSLDGDDELFDVDVIYGAFQEGEVISYGDITNTSQIVVWIEAGTYYENLPLKVPQNVSIRGDEFRRVIVRPLSGYPSSSPWSFLNFRRDLTVDGLTTADRLFGYHYLTDTSKPVYPIINNPGFYSSASTLLRLNKAFIQNEMIGWINDQISNRIYPFNTSYFFDEELCRRDSGYLVDAAYYDVAFGSNFWAVQNGLAYQRLQSSVVLTEQLEQELAAINYIKGQVAIAMSGNATAVSRAFDVYTEITDIIENGIANADVIVWTDPGTDVNTTRARQQLINNKEFIISEMVDWLDANWTSVWTSLDSLNKAKWQRDMGYAIDALAYDSQYGGNIATRNICRSLFSAITGEAMHPLSQKAATAATYTNIGVIAAQIVRGSYVGQDNTAGDAGVLRATAMGTLTGYVSAVVTAGNLSGLVSESVPSISWIDAPLQASVNAVSAAKSSIVNGTITFLADTYSVPFTYNETLCKRDYGHFVDAFSYDLKHGSYDRTISAALKYRGPVTAYGDPAVTVTSQLLQSLAGLERFKYLAERVVKNIVITDTFTTTTQIADAAYQAELGSNAIEKTITQVFTTIPVRVVTSANHGYADKEQVTISDISLGTTELNGNTYYAKIHSSTAIDLYSDFELTVPVDGTGFTSYVTGSGGIVTPQGGVLGILIDTMSAVLSDSPDVNLPKDNDELDIFLMNDATILRALTMAGHGGFAMVLDPNGQILAKSPYAQEGAVFSRSTGYQKFTGGMFVDGFSGNLQFQIDSKITDTRLLVSGLVRQPLLPCSFIVDDTVYRINYLRQFIFDINGSTAQFELDETTPYTKTVGEFNCTISIGSNATVTLVDHGLQAQASVRFTTTGALPTGITVGQDYFVSAVGKTQNTFRISETPFGPTVTTSGSQSGTQSVRRIYEVLMPGNRSMLSNDFTQVNDMGYGLIATNGGLTECVSMFTYYCHISYYSIGGGQIRSIGGSSSHGNYALVAEGSDPLEVPTPVSLYYDLSQGISCYAPSPSYFNIIKGLLIYVNNYTYVPLDGSELEIDHDGEIVRYSISSVSTADLPAGVARLNISSAGNTSDAAVGLQAVVADGELMTIRANSSVVLTGDIVAVATRPSTALVLNESANDIYRVLQFSDYFDPVGTQVCTIDVADPVSITTGSDHGQLAGYKVRFSTTGTLPTGLTTTDDYWIVEDGLTATQFRVSLTRAGIPVATTSAGSGTHSFDPRGLGATSLRENYNYVDLALWSTQEFVGTPGACTITIASPAVITKNSHGFNDGDVIKFTTTGSLPTGLIATRMYFVVNKTANDFQVSTDLGGTPQDTSGSQSGTHTVGLVEGRVGDSTFAVVPVGPNDKSRLNGVNMKFVFKGQEYTITQYDDESVTLQPFARIYLDIPLVNSVIAYSSLPSLKAGVPKRSESANGTLTIRISLTRVTSHDLLDIGTGSYADTNYPNEIYGGSVNPRDDSKETEERNSGRVFYVTTDQFGNFNVGPYFRVDQGTGTVTFSAAIALSNLDGIGFKRGVTVAEFSTDTAMSDNATDSVPTENAVRTYIDRRLGITHDGIDTLSTQIIPLSTGGFLPLTGQLSMKGDINLQDSATPSIYHKITNLGNPVLARDAVNLQSLTLENLQDTSLGNIDGGDLLAFTGTGSQTVNAKITGDIELSSLVTGPDSTLNQINLQIKANTIINADVNSSADINQTKLSLNLATTASAAPTGTAAAKQAASGIASFDTTQFTVTDGFVTVKDNGVALTRLAQLPSDNAIGNGTGATANAAATPFSTIVNRGGGVKKEQYSTGTGYLRRTGLSYTGDGDFTIVDESTSNTINTLVKRDGNGDFAARVVTISQLKVDDKLTIDTETTGVGTGQGYTKYYGYLGQAGLLIGDGGTSTDKKNLYYNNSHDFYTNPGGVLSLAPITAGSITVGSLIANGAGSTGTVSGVWTLNSGARFQATYSADLAEYYEGDKEYEVGTVLIFGGDKEVTISNTHSDYRVAGVVSDNAGYIMNGSCPGLKNLIALQGRVPCRVVGRISKGDLMVTSNIAGVAISAKGSAQTGTVIGKALEDYGSDHIGTIEVAVGRA